MNLKKTNKLETYLKNCCVSALSAVGHGGADADVAVVTNIDFPEPYAGILQRGGVRLMKCAFEHFRFASDYKWMLAFYKLCALRHVVSTTEYRRFLCMDSDVWVQAPLCDVWQECDGGALLLYDISDGVEEQGLRREAGEFTGTDFRRWTHYGGEFIAAGREAATQFLARAESLFDEMEQRHFSTQCGDEFITSVAAQTCGVPIHHAGAYVYRYWTRRFRLICTNYRFTPVAVLHVPAEKETGMLTLYKRYVRHGRLPKRKSTVWRLLHLNRAPFEIWLYWWVMDLLHRP